MLVQVWEVKSLDYTNHTVTSNTSTDNIVADGEKINAEGKDGASRSEIYKMNNNGLMLLHAQRAHSDIESKKSELVDNAVAGSSINYHVRKRNRNNDTKHTVVENEKYLESKLGDLPQVHKKRSINRPDKKENRISLTSDAMKERTF